MNSKDQIMHELGNPEHLVSTQMGTSCWKTQLGPSSFAAFGRRQHSVLLEHKQLAVSVAQALGSNSFSQLYRAQCSHWAPFASHSRDWG